MIFLPGNSILSGHLRHRSLTVFSAMAPNLRSDVGDAHLTPGYEIDEINEISYRCTHLFRIFHTKRRWVTNLIGDGLYRLRKNSVLG